MNPALQPRVLDSLRHYLPPKSESGLPLICSAQTLRHALRQFPHPLCTRSPSIRTERCRCWIRPPTKLPASRHVMTHNSHLHPSRAPFGTPKPTLTHSFRPGLLYLRTFPALMGFSSRILAESWESNNLFYAALAYEAGVPANQLDSYVPEWNRAAIENIFATHLEDWPALLRSLDTLGNSVRQKGAASGSNEQLGELRLVSNFFKVFTAAGVTGFSAPASGFMLKTKLLSK